MSSRHIRVPRIDPTIFTGPRATNALILAQAQMETGLRGLLSETSTRSKFRMHPTHVSLAIELALCELSHAEVSTVSGFAQHDGSILSNCGPARLLKDLKDKTNGVAMSKLMETVAKADALSAFYNGKMNALGHLVVVHENGKQGVIFPSEILPNGPLQPNADVAIATRSPRGLSLINNNAILMNLSWLEHDIPMSECDPNLVNRLCGAWKGGGCEVVIETDGDRLRAQLAKGTPAKLLNASLSRKDEPLPLKFALDDIIICSAKAANSTLSGNTGTYGRGVATETGGEDMVAAVCLLPLFSYNGRNTGGEAEHPKGSTLLTAETVVKVQETALNDGKEVPIGIQFGNLMVDGARGPELPACALKSEMDSLQKLACATLLRMIFERTRTTEESQDFRSTLEALIDNLSKDHSEAAWATWKTLRWVGIGVNTHAGVALPRGVINHLIDAQARHPTDGQRALLHQSGILGLPPAVIFPSKPPEGLDPAKTQEALDQMATLSAGRGVILALEQLSEMAHRRRKTIPL